MGRAQRRPRLPPGLTVGGVDGEQAVHRAGDEAVGVVPRPDLREAVDRIGAAIAAGADSLIIEAHDDPEHALTDGAQSITPKTLKETMKVLKRIAEAVEREI